MADASNRTFVGSILFLDIVEYSKRSVAEQMRQKQKFNAILEQALQSVAVSDRIVLDTGDGAAISFLGNPEDAVYVGMALRNSIESDPPSDPGRLAVRTGVNLGPVRLIKDLNGQLNIIGDGINVAQRVMSFADAGQILVSRSYYEVVSRLDPHFEKLFRYEGARTDKHVREHEVYAVGISTGPLPAPVVSIAASPAAAAPKVVGPAWRFNKRLGVALPAAMALIIAGGFLVRVQRHAQPAAAPVAIAPSPPTEAPAPAAQPAPFKALGLAGPKTPPAAQPAPFKALGLEASKAPPAARPEPFKARPEAPGREELEKGEAFKREALKREALREAKAALEEGNAAALLLIVPWGEVFVDGQPRGVSPPLRVLELPPGPHKVEIRNGSFPAHTEQVSVRPGEKLTIRHRFN
jgi:hypothetical protein